jgi:hypothetical protein
LLALEGTSGDSAEACAKAAGRVYDKLNSQLAPLLGFPGVQALFIRSAKLVRDEFTALSEITALESSAKLRERLQALESGVAAQTAEALFGTFFGLITTFIGERLTTQALRGAWPTIEDTAPTENKK